MSSRAVKPIYRTSAPLGPKSHIDNVGRAVVPVKRVVHVLTTRISVLPPEKPLRR